MGLKLSKRNKLYLLNLLLIVLVIACILVLRNYQNEFNLIKNVSIKYFIVLSAIALLNGIVNGLKVKYYTKIFGLNLSFKESFGLSEITSLTNYVTPFKGGTAFRALYLKKKYNFSYEKFIVVMGAASLIAFFGYSIVGMLSTLYSFLAHKTVNLLILGIFITIFTASLIAFFLPLNYMHRIKSENFIIRKLKSAIEGWYILKNKPYNLLIILIVELTFLFSYSLSIFYGFRAIGVNTPLVYCLIISLVSSMSVIFTITPAGLGVREAVIVWASTALEQGIIVPLNVAILIRLISMIWAIPLGLLFSYIFIKEEKKQIDV